MNAVETAHAINELKSAWPYQNVPDDHVRHWRDVLRVHSTGVVFEVLRDCKRTMKGRPSWGEFGAMCIQLEATQARERARGPYLSDIPRNEITPEDELGTRIAELKARAKR